MRSCKFVAMNPEFWSYRTRRGSPGAVKERVKTGFGHRVATQALSAWSFSATNKDLVDHHPDAERRSIHCDVP
jgi:hypothetical protein